MVIVERGNRCGRLPYGASTACAPHWPIGITGQPVSSAIRAAPDLPVIGQVAGVAGDRPLGVDHDELAGPDGRDRRVEGTDGVLAQPFDRDHAPPT